MAWRVFAVVLDDPNREAIERLEQKYGEDFLKLGSGVALVRTRKAVASTVAREAEIGEDAEDQSAEGLVIRVFPDQCAGYTFRSVWKWLKDAEKDPE